MSEPVEVFFYGLFMDPEALSAKGLKPVNPRKASIPGMQLKIGNRATLVPSSNSVAHGMVMTLDRQEIDHLYSEPSVAAYRPEIVNCACADGSSIRVLCYNLAQSDDSPPNLEYAAKLRAVAERLGLPSDYIEAMQ